MRKDYQDCNFQPYRKEEKRKYYSSVDSFKGKEKKIDIQAIYVRLDKHNSILEKD